MLFWISQQSHMPDLCELKASYSPRYQLGFSWSTRTRDFLLVSPCWQYIIEKLLLINCNIVYFFFFTILCSCRGKEVLAASESNNMTSTKLADVISGKESHCTVSTRAPLWIIYAALFAQIAIGIAAGVWGLNRSSANSWHSLFLR